MVAKKTKVKTKTKKKTTKKAVEEKKEVVEQKEENMGGMLDKLKGKKTYLTAIVVGVIAAVESLGYTIPGFVYHMLGAIGLGTLRHGMK